MIGSTLIKWDGAKTTFPVSWKQNSNVSEEVAAEV